MTDRRHQNAREQADRLDSRWFAANAPRIHRVRPSRPFEMPDWEADGHQRFPIMLVKRLAGHLLRRPASGPRPTDDETTLRSIWDRVDAIQAFAGHHVQETAQIKLGSL
jgi:hypothetical protein